MRTVLAVGLAPPAVSALWLALSVARREVDDAARASSSFADR